MRTHTVPARASSKVQGCHHSALPEPVRPRNMAAAPAPRRPLRPLVRPAAGQLLARGRLTAPRAIYTRARARVLA